MLLTVYAQLRVVVIRVFKAIHFLEGRVYSAPRLLAFMGHVVPAAQEQKAPYFLVLTVYLSPTSIHSCFQADAY